MTAAEPMTDADIRELDALFSNTGAAFLRRGEWFSIRARLDRAEAALAARDTPKEPS